MNSSINEPSAADSGAPYLGIQLSGKRRKTISLGRKFAGVVCLTVALVGVAGYFAGQSILEQVANLSDDHVLSEELGTCQRALVAWHKERVARVTPYLATCRSLHDATSCKIPGEGVTTMPLSAAALPDGTPGWQTETAYVDQQTKAQGGQVYRVKFSWEELRPRYRAVTEIIGTREHLAAVLPSLVRSFLLVFAAALAAAGLVGLLITFLLSRRLALRVTKLVDYTRRIATGTLAPAPAATRGPDEVGLLAEALHTMAGDLDATRQKLVLAEKMQSWQNVARKVAHEIKNPLTPLTLVADELKKRADADSPPMPPAIRTLLLEASRVLSEESQSLGRMVREFTAFARLPEPDLQAGDLAEVVRDFINRNLSEQGPDLRLAGESPPLPVIIDRAMIVQILHNIVNNARLAKAPARVTVQFTLRTEGSDCLLDLTDNAGGVPESLRASLFDAYVTTRSTGDGEKGMGLGLTIARKIALDHGGSLVLAHTGPDGSCFRLKVPLAAFRQPPLGSTKP